MAGDWIKILTSLPTSGKIVRISSACDADILRTLGGCVSALCLADVHADPRGDEGWLDGYTPEALDNHIGLVGLTRALESAGWVRVEAQAVVFLEFTKHNGTSAKRRAMDAERKKRVRKVSASDADVLRTREEQEQPRADADAIANARAGELGLLADAIAALTAVGVRPKVAEALARGGVTADEVREDVVIVSADRSVRQPVSVLVTRLKDRHGIRLPKGKELTGDVQAFGRHIANLQKTHRIEA